MTRNYLRKTGYGAAEEFDALVTPEDMTHP